MNKSIHSPIELLRYIVMFKYTVRTKQLFQKKNVFSNAVNIICIELLRACMSDSVVGRIFLTTIFPR